MNILTDLRDFFFPRLCPICGKRLLPLEKGICLCCSARLPYTELGNSIGNKLERLFWGRLPIERGTSLFYYHKGGDVALILYAMKYHGRKQLCSEMGRLIGSELQATGFFEGIDCLLPVPLHKSRLRKRGYNQSEQLAKGISEKTGIPVCTTAICRVRNNETQTGKSGNERWINAEDLFQATPRAAQLCNKHVLLIDDVLTTGATITACADALAGIKDIRISVVTLAWSQN